MASNLKAAVVVETWGRDDLVVGWEMKDRWTVRDALASNCGSDVGDDSEEYDDANAAAATQLGGQESQEDMFAITTVLDSLRLRRSGGVRLGRNASRLAHEENLGGSSTVSEALSCELLRRLWGTSSSGGRRGNLGGHANYESGFQVQTETEVRYWTPYGGKVDFLLQKPATRPADGLTRDVGAAEVATLGVSVTRAMHHISEERFSQKDALRLLRTKLAKLVSAREAAVDGHLWRKPVLHIFCQSPRIQRMLADALQDRDSLRSLSVILEGSNTDAGSSGPEDVIVMLTECADIQAVFTNDESIFVSPSTTSPDVAPAAAAAAPAAELPTEKHVGQPATTSPS